MTHAGSKHQLRPVHLVEHQSLEDSRLTVVIVQIFLKGRLGEGLVEEYAAVRAQHADGDAVVHELLSVLVLHHAQTVVSHAPHLHLVVLVEPLDVLGLLIFLHADRLLRFRRLHTLHDDILRLFLLTTACGQHACHQQDK